MRSVSLASLAVFAASVSLFALGSACAPPTADVNYNGRSKDDDGETDKENTEATDPSTTPGETSEPTTDGDGGTTTTTTSSGTGGKGGATGSTQSFTSVSGLKYMINAPAPGAKPRGVIVFLHGSTASNYTKGVDMFAAVATTYDLIRVSVLAPNGQGWNEGNQADGAEKLHQLVQQDLFAKYDIDKNRVLFSGQSSGSGFLSTNFIPAHAKDYRGGAFLQCGAGSPPASFMPDAATKAGFKMHFEITTGDTIWPQQYAAGTAKYASLGMQLTKDNTKPGGHCQFDQQAIVQAHIGFVLGTTP